MKFNKILAAVGMLFILSVPSHALADEGNSFQREQASAYLAMFMERLERNMKLIEMAQRTDPSLINGQTRNLIDDDINKVLQGMSGLIHPEPRFDKPKQSMQVPGNNYLLRKGLRR